MTRQTDRLKVVIASFFFFFSVAALLCSSSHCMELDKDARTAAGLRSAISSSGVEVGGSSGFGGPSRSPRAIPLPTATPGAHEEEKLGCCSNVFGVCCGSCCGNEYGRQERTTCSKMLGQCFCCNVISTTQEEIRIEQLLGYSKRHDPQNVREGLDLERQLNYYRYTKEFKSKKSLYGNLSESFELWSTLFLIGGTAATASSAAFSDEDSGNIDTARNLDIAAVVANVIGIAFNRFSITFKKWSLDYEEKLKDERKRYREYFSADPETEEK